METEFWMEHLRNELTAMFTYLNIVLVVTFSFEGGNAGSFQQDAFKLWKCPAACKTSGVLLFTK